MSLVEDIRIWPDEVLRTECRPIKEITSDITALAERMLETMYEADGCGLAAPQVGYDLQLIVMDVDYDGEGNANPYVLINPEIVLADGAPRVMNEGCLSFPGITVEVERPSHVVVRARNLEGKLMQYEASNNLMCVCLQHEIDHIHGVTMVDHVSVKERSEALTALRTALDAGARPGEVAISEDLLRSEGAVCSNEEAPRSTPEADDHAPGLGA